MRHVRPSPQPRAAGLLSLSKGGALAEGQPPTAAIRPVSERNFVAMTKRALTFQPLEAP
jgi:hypothetical protein